MSAREWIVLAVFSGWLAWCVYIKPLIDHEKRMKALGIPPEQW